MDNFILHFSPPLPVECGSMKIKRNITCLILALSLLLPMTAFGETVPAPTEIDTISQSPQTNDRPIGRGEAVAKMVKTLGLEERNKDFLDLCFNVPDECFFAFGAQSDFDGISFDPLVLYPDVPAANRFSREINVATALGLVKGYPENNTPFKPQGNLLRIHALKIVLEAQGLVQWKEYFELEGDEKERFAKYKDLEDAPEAFKQVWWMVRYICFAINYGIHLDEIGVNFNNFEGMLDPISVQEFDHMLDQSIQIYEKNKKADSSRDPLI